jgi:hypothetical protein
MSFFYRQRGRGSKAAPTPLRLEAKDLLARLITPLSDRESISTIHHHFKCLYLLLIRGAELVGAPSP